MRIASVTRPRARPRALLVAAAIGLGAACGQAAAGELPRTAEDLVSAVRAALEGGDMDAMSRLVNWDEARKVRRRVVAYQIRTAFGRPIRSVTLEPFPEGGLDAATARGTMKANMTVSHRIRVVFDEPDVEAGRPPTDLFLVGRQGEAYRIALVVPTGRPGD